MSDNKGFSFGITQDTKTSNSTPILVATKVENNPQFPNGWKFPIARLVNVTTNPEFILKDGSTTAVLQFVFADKDKRQHIHTEWLLDVDDANFSKKMEGMQVRIAHIYEAIFVKIPEAGIGVGATDFVDFFNKVKDTFQEQITVKDDKKYYTFTQIEVYLKLTYYNKNIGFPLSPNFIEKVVLNKACTTLTINAAYDVLAPKATTSGIPGISGGASISPTDDLPSFDGQFE